MRPRRPGPQGPELLGRRRASTWGSWELGGVRERGAAAFARLPSSPKLREVGAGYSPYLRGVSSETPELRPGLSTAPAKRKWDFLAVTSG